MVNVPDEDEWLAPSEARVLLHADELDPAKATAPDGKRAELASFDGYLVDPLP